MSTITEASVQSARPTRFMDAVDRLKEEHDALKIRLSAVQAKAQSVGKMKTVPEAMALLQQLREEITDFRTELDRHATWEERELFPLLCNYFNKYSGPSMMPSFWVMEKDHELAETFIDSFIESVDRLSLPTREAIRETSSHLIQACLILNEHLNLEEDIVYPMAEQILDDIDSLFS
ncbi:hemerythrin domain-containing protein [Paenibacillus elgii]